MAGQMYDGSKWDSLYPSRRKELDLIYANAYRQRSGGLSAAWAAGGGLFDSHVQHPAI